MSRRVAVSTSRTDLLEPRLRKMNEEHQQLVMRMEEYERRLYSPADREHELGLLTDAIVKQIARVKEAEHELDLRESQLNNTSISTIHKQRQDLAKQEKDLDFSLARVLKDKHTLKNGSKPESEARLRAKLIIRKKELDTQSVICQQEQAEVERLAEEIQKISEQLRIEREALETESKAIAQEEQDLEGQWNDYEARVKQVEAQEEALQLNNHNTITKTQLLEEEIHKLQTELAHMQEEEQDLDKEIAILQTRALDTEEETDEVSAKEEALKQEERELVEKERQLAQKLQEAEEKERTLNKYRELEAETELVLKGMLLNEDVYKSKVREELKLLGRVKK